MDKALSVQTANTEMPTKDPNNAGGEEQESVYPIEDLELLATNTKH